MDINSLLIAVVTGTSMHRLAEPGNINYKLRRLSTAVSTGKVETPPLKGINTRAKAYGMGMMVVVVGAVIAYFVSGIFNPTAKAAIIYSVILLFVADVLTMAAIDKYHVAIEVLTKKFGKK